MPTFWTAVKNCKVCSVKKVSQVIYNVHNLVTSGVKSNMNSTLKLSYTLFLRALYRSGIIAQVAEMFAQKRKDLLRKKNNWREHWG